MIAIVCSPSIMSAIEDRRFIAAAVDIVQPDLAWSRLIRVTTAGVPETSTDDAGEISVGVGGVVADGSPNAVVKNFHATRSRVCASIAGDQSDHAWDFEITLITSQSVRQFI